MSFRRMVITSAVIALTVVSTVALSTSAGASEVRSDTVTASDAECGKMYLWGREVQNEPYNRAASLARCRDSQPVNHTAETTANAEAPQNQSLQPAQ